jgi:hypothetical protein
MHIEEFDAAMIERYLALRGLVFGRGDDGRDFVLPMSCEAGRLRVRLRVSGSSRRLVTIRLRRAEHYDATHRNRLMELVNEWNRDYRWPKAYVRETSDPARIEVVGENCFPLTEGIHFEAFTALVDFTIRGAVELFEKIGPAVELPSARTLERWLHQPAAGGE